MKVEFKLTSEQKKALEPIFQEIERAYNESLSPRSAVLGQAWLSRGTAEFHFINHEQCKILDRALKRAGLKENGTQPHRRKSS